ncbi:MAG: GtrA family protein [Chromatiales bacterium]|nr:GtrA family protein [Chromatiales bacterium]
MKFREILRRERVRRWLRFGAVGATGFLIEASLITLLVHGLGWGPYQARMISFPIAVSVTWYLNRTFTFADLAGGCRKREYGRYVLVNTVGAGTNLSVYAIAVALSGQIARWPVLGLVLGAGAGMFINYLGARHFAFRPDRQEVEA